ncbi:MULTISPECIES: hypothetical protein, partial [unclassified Acinetobacter]|uniref:hypothetical protein n=1 Tax=unclassified Acinetobacter TaxID=196816 RepID=UPI001A913D46
HSILIFEFNGHFSQFQNRDKNHDSIFLCKNNCVFAEYSHNKLRFISSSVKLLSFFAEFH